jgi:GNAT superfamily N-acetyltransferase
MHDRASSFLVSVLGEPGAKAFQKAMQTERSLASAVVPRVIVSWIDLATKFSYSGAIPGLENTFVEFRKSDKGFDGAISIGSDIYNFSNATACHLAASVAVALGIDTAGVTDQTRDATLQRLGKSIDTLVKSRIASEALEKREALKKAISLIPPGPEVRESRNVIAPNSHLSSQGYRVHNFGHVLSPEHQQAGYQLHVLHNPKSGGINAIMTQRDPVYGLRQVGYLKSIHEGQNLEVNDADLDKSYWGKGLGTAMYEAVMAHGFHSGARQVVGDIHSTLAPKAHQRISAKHGMDYQATPTPAPQLISGHGPDDNRVGPYQYALKTELIKGLNGNWQNEGYSFKQMVSNDGNLRITAHSPDGQEVGWYSFVPAGNNSLHADSSETHLEHQRKGLATAAYSLAEKHFGRKLTPETSIQSPSAKALWAQKTRPFGKVEQPGTSSKPTPQQEAIKPEAPQFQTTQPKPPPKAQTVRISKSESVVKCSMCRRPQFVDGTFRGCLCFRELSKAVTILKADDRGYTLRFDAEWDTDAIRALRESMRE